jgi:GntR family transcriptional regulator
MIFQVDFKAGKPVYLQLVDQIRYAAASGVLRSGEALPSVRTLADELRVNRNTVAKAYTELEGQGVIETIPGKGCFLKTTDSPFTKQARQRILLKEIDEAVVAAHHLQVNRATFLALVRERLAFFEGKAAEARANEIRATESRAGTARS